MVVVAQLMGEVEAAQVAEVEAAQVAVAEVEAEVAEVAVEVDLLESWVGWWWWP